MGGLSRYSLGADFGPEKPRPTAPQKAGAGWVFQPPGAASQGCWPQVANPRRTATRAGENGAEERCRTEFGVVQYAPGSQIP